MFWTSALHQTSALDVTALSPYNQITMKTPKLGSAIVHVTLLFITLFTTGCVSSLLKAPAPKFSSEVNLPDMPANFTKLTSSVFPAWKNHQTNNVISIISECADNTTSLKSIHTLISESVESFTVIEEKEIQFQSLPAYSKNIKGLFGDHPIAVQSLSFKRKNCFYLASLTGPPENLNADKAQFQNFLEKIELKK